ncbi:hypothetical protein T4B_4864, partial [Trichinella pseudospiralis]
LCACCVVYVRLVFKRPMGNKLRKQVGTVVVGKRHSDGAGPLPTEQAPSNKPPPTVVIQESSGDTSALPQQGTTAATSAESNKKRKNKFCVEEKEGEGRQSDAGDGDGDDDGGDGGCGWVACCEGGDNSIDRNVSIAAAAVDHLVSVL